MTQRTRIRAAAASAMIALATLACAPSVLAQAAANPNDILAKADQPTFTFTFRSAEFADANTSVWGDGFNLSAMELSAGDKWGFTLGLENSDTRTFELDGVSAGAFFDITPRVRVGGALSFTESDELFSRGGASREDIPEVKFESAFKF